MSLSHLFLFYIRCPQFGHPKSHPLQQSKIPLSSSLNPSPLGLEDYPSMEYSLGSGDHPKGKIEAAGDEESGWTRYLEDSSYEHELIRNQQGEFPSPSATAAEEEEGERGGCSSLVIDDDDASSLVSDAGTGPEWKNRMDHTATNINQRQGPSQVNTTIKRSLLDREWTAQQKLDHSLEDTASSPVKSPRIDSSFKVIDAISPRIKASSDDECYDGCYLGKAGGSCSGYGADGNPTALGRVRGGGGDEQMRIDTASTSCDGTEQDDELKKKGLCLVPISHSDQLAS